MGLFSKKQYADIIYRNAVIHTLDPDYPDAEAIACKDGCILALGDEDAVLAFKGRETEVVDLEGASVLPGFFSMNGTIIRDAYSEIALPLSDTLTEEEVLQAVAGYIRKNPDSPAYLAFGYSDLLFRNSGSEEAPVRLALDALSPDKPLILLSATGNFAIVSSRALEDAHKALTEEIRIMQEEEGKKAVPLGNNSAADAVLRTKTEEGVDVDGEYDYDELSEDSDTDSSGNASGTEAAAGSSGESEAAASAGSSLASDAAASSDESREPVPENPWPFYRDILPGFQFFGRNKAGIPTGFLAGPATISQFLNITGVFDSDLLPKAIVRASLSYAEKGYTTVLDAGSPDYFIRTFMSTQTELLQSGLSLQRNIVTTLLEDETDTYLSLQRLKQKETLCVECGGLLDANAVRLIAKSVPASPKTPSSEVACADGNGAEGTGSSSDLPADASTDGMRSTLSPEFFANYATECLDHGFDVLSIVYGKAAADAALEGLSSAREKTRKGRLVVCLADGPGVSDKPSMTEEEEKEYRDAFELSSIPIIGTPKTTAQKLSVLTGRKRHLLRNNENAGVLSVGEPCDFTVLDESPMGEDGEPKDPASYSVAYTVLGGYTVSRNPEDYVLEDFGDFADFGEDSE